jgi:hypothetical protein
LESEILFQKCVLHIFRNLETYYLLFLDLWFRRYDFPKFQHNFVYFLIQFSI